MRVSRWLQGLPNGIEKGAILKKKTDFPQFDSSMNALEGSSESGLDVRSGFVGDKLLKEFFEQIPLGVTVEDYSDVKRIVDQLRNEGVDNLNRHLNENPDLVTELVMSVELLDANSSMLNMYRVDSYQDYVDLEENFKHWKDSGWIEYYIQEITGLAEKGQYFGDISDLAVDGTPIEVRCISQVLGEHEKDWSQVITTHEDVTERKRSRDALRENEAMLASIINNLPTEIAIKDLDGRYKLLNPQFAKRFDVDNANLLGKTIKDLDSVTSEYAEKITEQDKRILETREIISAENQYLRPDGRLGTELVIKFPILDFEGAVTGTGTIATDITDRKRAEEELLVRDTWLDAIFENAPIEIVFKDVEGRIIAISRSVANILGHDRDEFIGRTSADFLPGDIADIYMAADRDVIDSGELRQQEIIEEIGETKRYSLSAKFPVRDQAGMITGICSMTTDITELKQANEARQLALAEAQQANRAKSEFLATMSHELRTPLNAIKGFSEMFIGQFFGALGSPKYEEYAHDIRDSSEHLIDLVNDVLDLSAVEAGKQFLTKENLNVHDIIMDLSPIIATASDRKRITFSVDVSTDSAALHADRRAMKQILINVLSNAVKFTPAGGRVTLKVTVSNGHQVFEVSDTGEGIAADKLPSLTDPFVRAESDPHKTHEGTGLGLAIVKSLVDLHGGELTIESEVGKGTTLTVMIPSQGTVIN